MAIRSSPARTTAERVFRFAFPCILLTLWAASATGLQSDRVQSQDAPAQLAPGDIRGTVTDPSGAVVAGAVVTLETASPPGSRTTITDTSGSFRFSRVGSGICKITITASGFTDWTASDLTAAASENTPISVELRVAPASEQVTVTPPPRELAVEQLKTEEKQRLAGILPHYFVTYEQNPAPLTAKQKFQLGWKTFFDPVPLLFGAAGAGIQQARNSYPEFGQGAEGYAKRLGANYADRLGGIMARRVLMQSVLRQDPRYFYRGHGSFGSRALYAIATAFVCKGDNGRWQPAYSSVLGGMASYGLSTLYRPGTSRPWLRLSHTVLLGFSGRASNHLFEEFVLRKLTTHVPKRAMALSRPVLRAGTPVSLISEELSSEAAGPIAFTLAGDIRMEGAVVAKAGSQALGQASYAAPSAEGESIRLGLSRVRLAVGKVDVPLRSTPIRGDNTAALQYHILENSSRIAVVLYVDEDAALDPIQ